MHLPQTKLVCGLAIALVCTLVLSKIADAAPKPTPPPAIEVITDGEMLQPSSTIEFRFSRPVIPREEITGAPVRSPIIFSPALPGKFVWLSSQSGVYSPDSVPPLGVRYSLTARGDLKDIEGNPLGRYFRATLTTPEFGVTTVRNGVYDAENVAPDLEVRLVFNSAIDLASAQKLFSFKSDNGDKISATVRFGNTKDGIAKPASEANWEQRWQLARQPGAPTPAPSDESEDEESETPEKAAELEKPIENTLSIAPAKLLTPDTTWRLELAGGLRSQSGKYQIPKSATFDLGMVRAFVVKSVETESLIHSGRAVAIEFSRQLAPDIEEENGLKYFRVSPEVPKLKFERGWGTITLRGEFDPTKKYRVEIDKAVISSEGLPLDKKRTWEFEFDRVDPRLYLPQITAHQIRAGRRQFEVESVNLKGLHVVARRVAPADIAKAVEAFEKYSERDDEHPDEFYKKLPDEAIAGEIVSDQQIELVSKDVDAPQRTTLEWDKIVGAQKPGAIFLTVEGDAVPEIEAKRMGAQALIQVTDLGVLWKKVESALQVSVFSHANAKPVSGARVQLLDATFGELHAVKTDNAGAAQLPITSDPAWLVVQNGDDAHAMRMGPRANELPMARTGVLVGYSDWNEPLEKRNPSLGFVFTDRPLYQLDDEVKVKGFLRRSTGKGLEPVASRTGKLVLTNPRGDDVQNVEIKTDDRGSFDTTIKLVSANSGQHTLTAKFAENDNDTRDSFSTQFQVAAYQPNAFELSVQMPKRLRATDPLRVPVSAKYFFGAPITRADARWTLRYLADAFSPEDFANFKFGPEDFAHRNALTLRGEGTLSPSAPFEIAPQLPTPEGAPRNGVLTVEVTDANQQTVSDTQRFVHDASDFYLGIATPSRGVFEPGEEVSIRAIAIQPDAQPAENNVKVNTELFRIRHETVRVQSAGKAISFRTDKIEEKIAEQAGETVSPTKEGEQWQARQGETAKFKPDKAGQYQIRVAAQDAQGRQVLSEWGFYVAGPGEESWDYHNPNIVDLVPDKAEYQPGDKAKILVKTPISGDAVVSIEREERVVRTVRVRLDGNAPAFEVPIERGDSPNIYVNLMIIRGAESSTKKFKMPEFRYGVCMLRVPNTRDHLQVAISPAKNEVRPGDEIEAEIVVRDGSGAAAGDTEVTFWAADDGVLALTGYERPQPFEIFSQPLPLRVRTGLTLFELMSEDPANIDFFNKGYLIGGGGGEGPGAKLRRDFPGTACWMPSLRTDRNGKVRAKFRAPDAMTRYRLVAVVHAGGSMFGSGESAVTIRKPLILLPALGQFANVGDQLIARAVIRNDTGANGTAEVSLALDATAESTEPTSAKIEIPNGEAKTVDFPIKLRAVGKAEWKWSARMQSKGGKFEDHVLSTLPVGSPMLALRETYVSDAREKSNDLLAGVNPQIREGIGKVAVTVANTRLSSLRGSIKHLREYPYGCAEQTVSSLIPWVVLPELRPVLPELKEGEETDAITKGIEKIFSMQTSSGGISFWPGRNRPDFFVSAYAAIALAALEKQGADLPAGKGMLLTYLSTELRGMPKIRNELDLADRALGLFALAASGKAEPAYHEELFNRRSELSLESRAMLALAIAESSGPAQMIEDLVDVRKPAPESFSWFGSGARETAIQLMVWSKHNPQSPEIGRLTSELLKFRVNGRWRTTQENAWALLALARYYTQSERGGGPAQGAIVFRDQSIPFNVAKEQPAKTETLAFDLQKPLTALRVENPKTAAVFTDAQFDVHPPLGEQPRQDRGFAISRNYHKLGDDGALTEAVDLKVGDRVLVTLRLEATRPARFVAIDDPLPAIFEAVNPAFTSRAVAGGENLEQDYVSDYREVRADRVQIFCDSLPQGAFTFRYLARVRSAGDTTAPSTKAEEMYRPERFGIAETMRVSSKAAEAK